jgi:hypothetical protein
MNRTEFEALRDLDGKILRGDIRFSRSRATSPLLVAEIAIENPQNRDMRMVLHYNTETDSKTINVVVTGLGPICRLDIGGTEHGEVGRHHKHSLQTERCPSQNLRHADARDDLAGRTFRDVFDDFCEQARIEHRGTMFEPDERTAEVDEETET